MILDAEAGVRSDGNYAQVENLERADVQSDESIARSGFNLRLSYELPRMLLALGYSPSYEWVLDNGGVNGTTHRLNLGLTGNVTRRLKLNVRERLVSSPNIDLYAPFDQPETIAVTRRGDQLSHALDVSAAQEITRRTSVLLGATHTLRTFESGDLADTETLSGRAGLGFQLAPDRRLDITATQGTYDFGDGRSSGDVGLRRLGRNGEADVQTLSLGWSQDFLREGQFRVEAGVFSVDSQRIVALGSDVEGQPLEEVRVEEEDTGWRGAVNLSRRLELFDWNLGYRHDVSAGAGFGRAVQVDNAFAGVSTRIGRSLTLGLDANGSRHQDLSDEGTDPNDPLLQPERARLIEALAGTARFNWHFSQVAALNGGYSYIKQDSQVEPFEDLSYSRYFLGLALQLYRSGEEPRDPADAGETDDDEPDAQ
ncbi:MAG TPA: hypothetical protein VH394_01905 [Thermoanaerobaculia bacterium]|nr:hypothetical protein [Thermoanaerobaculia bacterium]